MAASLAALAALVWITRRRLHRYTDAFHHENPADEQLVPTELDDTDNDNEGAALDPPQSPADQPSGDVPVDRPARRAHRRTDLVAEPELDADLRPLPAVLNRVRALVQAHADAIPGMRPPTPELASASQLTQLPTPTSFTPPEPPASPARLPEWPSQREHQSSLGQQELPPVGPSGIELAGLPPIPPEGLGLNGPGAPDAARALLVATLTSGSPNDPDATGIVVTTLDTLNDLLGGQTTVDATTLQRLFVTADLDAALSILDELVLTRRRVLDEHDATNPQTLREDQPWSEPMPPVALIVHAPPDEAGPIKARLSTTLHLGAPLQIHGVLLGQWPRGHNLTIHDDGTVLEQSDSPSNTGHQAPVTRVAVLDRGPAVDLLRVVIEAHTGNPPTPTPEPAQETPLAAAPIAPIAADQSPADRLLHEPFTAGPDRPSAAGAGPADPAPVQPAQPEVAASPSLPARPAPPSSAGERVLVRVLGAPMILDRDGTPVPGLRAGATHLLVILATHRDGHPLMDIMEKVWPDATTRRAADRLSTEAANLRRTVRRALGRTEDRGPDTNAIINKSSVYLANPDLLDIDLWRMSDALAAARTSTNPAEQARHLQDAIDAHTGPLADGRDYTWADVLSHQLHRDGIRARLHLAALRSETGDVGEAARLITDAADLDPVNEDVAQRAIRACAAAGDTEGVRGRLRALRAALDEIGEEPTGETLALAANITIAKPPAPTTARRADSRQRRNREGSD